MSYLLLAGSHCSVWEKYLDSPRSRHLWPHRDRRSAIIGALNRASTSLEHDSAGINTTLLHAMRRQRFPSPWSSGLAKSEGFGLSIVIELVFIVVIVGQLFKVDLVAEYGTNTTKTLDELIAFTRAVGDEFEGSAKIGVLFG